MFDFDRYPNIKNAALELSYCNGGIFRERTEEIALKEISQGMFSERFVLNLTPVDMTAIDTALGSLNKDDLEIFLDGEEEERLKILKKFPDHVASNLDRLINLIFAYC